MNNNSEQINTIIKLELGDLNPENQTESIDNNENKENSDNYNTSNRDISS